MTHLLNSDTRGIGCGTVFGSTVNQTRRLGLESGLTRRTHGLSHDGRHTQVDYGSGISYQRGDLEALGWWRLSDGLRVGAGAGWFRHDLLRNSEGKYESIGGVVSARWTPSTRTSASIRWADQHRGEHLSGHIDHRYGRWAYRFTYLRALQDGNATILNNQTNLAALMAKQAKTGSLTDVAFRTNTCVHISCARA